MTKGFFAGVFWGAVLSVVALAILSLQLEPVKRVDLQPTEGEASAVTSASDPVADTVSDPSSDVPMAPADTAEPATETEGAAEPSASDLPGMGEENPEAATQAEPDLDATGGAAAPATTAPAGLPSDDATDQEGRDGRETEETPNEEGGDGGLAALAGPPKIKSEPVKPIGNLVTNVETGRLPSITSEPDAAEGAGSAIDPLSLAIERNAAPFENPEGRPLMAILLKDMGATRSALGDLKSLPFPISFIVQADAPDARAAIDFYRAAGAEVVVQIDLPDGATPSDAEVNFQAQSDLISQAVAVYMGAESGFQTDAPLARQISEILIVGGYGLVSNPQGLNTGHKNALKAGVAAGLVFRVLDDEGQDARTMGRFLDNAAFKAGQEAGVILTGRAEAQTLGALVSWSLGNRVKSVAMAPVSALLLGQ